MPQAKLWCVIEHVTSSLRFDSEVLHFTAFLLIDSQ